MTTTIKLALFDVSGTLTVENAWRGITEAPAITTAKRRRLISTFLPLWALQKVGLFPELRFRDLWIRALARLLRGMSRETVDAIFDWGVNTYLVDLYREDVVAELRQYRDDGVAVVIVSNIFQGMVDKLVARLDATGGIGTALAFDGDSVTGDLASAPSAGAQKVSNVQQWLAAHNMSIRLEDDAAAYADSISDVPLLAAVKQPTATYPDRRLLATASKNGWRVLS